MRIDKFLKVSRLVKRREVAKELCDAGKVALNGKPAKPSSEVMTGDRLALTLGLRRITVELLEIKPYANKETASSLYQIVEDVVEERTETC